MSPIPPLIVEQLSKEGLPITKGEMSNYQGSVGVTSPSSPYLIGNKSLMQLVTSDEGLGNFTIVASKQDFFSFEE